MLDCEWPQFACKLASCIDFIRSGNGHDLPRYTYVAAGKDT